MEASELNHHLSPLSGHEDRDKPADGALHLLDQCWFFDNLLASRRTRIALRCSNEPDPCSSAASSSQEHLVDECNIVESGIPIVHEVLGGTDDREIVDPGLDSDDGLLSLSAIYQKIAMPDRSFRNGLHRAPSLPPIDREKFSGQGDEENRHGNGSSKIARQSSLMNPPTHSLPPRITYKGNARASSTTIKTSCPQRISRAKSLNVDRLNRTTRHRQYLNHVDVTRKSLSDLETEEVQGFKDLGFRFEEGDITPNVVDILPGLQENKTFDDVANVRRPYLSEAWTLPETSPRSIPNWVARKPREDMKADIKFWARAVASNVREDCY